MRASSTLGWTWTGQSRPASAGLRGAVSRVLVRKLVSQHHLSARRQGRGRGSRTCGPSLSCVSTSAYGHQLSAQCLPTLVLCLVLLTTGAATTPPSYQHQRSWVPSSKAPTLRRQPGFSRVGVAPCGPCLMFGVLCMNAACLSTFHMQA
jgi:hypothetical protein